MKNPTKFVQVIILSVIMTFGVLVGASMTAKAYYPESCGTCDYDSGTDLTFCNFVYPGGGCGGNNGSACGSVGCGS